MKAADPGSPSPLLRRSPPPPPPACCDARSPKGEARASGERGLPAPPVAVDCPSSAIVCWWVSGMCSGGSTGSSESISACWDTTVGRSGGWLAPRRPRPGCEVLRGLTRSGLPWLTKGEGRGGARAPPAPGSGSWPGGSSRWGMRGGLPAAASAAAEGGVPAAAAGGVAVPPAAPGWGVSGGASTLTAASSRSAVAPAAAAPRLLSLSAENGSGGAPRWAVSDQARRRKRGVRAPTAFSRRRPGEAGRLGSLSRAAGAPPEERHCSAAISRRSRCSWLAAACASVASS